MRKLTHLLVLVSALTMVGCFNPMKKILGMTGDDESSESAGEDSSLAGAAHQDPTPGSPTAPEPTTGDYTPTTSQGPEPELTTTTEFTSAATPSTLGTESTGPATGEGSGLSTETGQETSDTGTGGQVCGNSVVDPGEQCDDGNADARGIDGCDEHCLRDALFVFVSSQVYIGDGFGQAAGDAECELLSASVNNKGFPDSVFVAWISDSSSPLVSEHILAAGDAALPYIRTDFVPVAADAADFTSGSLLNPIRTDEAGNFIDLNGEPSACEDPMLGVWTWTAPDGSGALGCELGSENGTIGSLNDADGLWTQACLRDCSFSAAVYCVELAPAP